VCSNKKQLNIHKKSAGALTERAVKAEGCLEQEKPHITLSSSFNEWTNSARIPGSLPPKVGQTLLHIVASICSKETEIKIIWKE
jgi:hypothetical protein